MAVVLSECPPCTGRCNQGRQCFSSTPAEACTDYGMDDELPPLTRLERFMVVAIYGGSVLCVLSLICLAASPW